MGVAQHSFLGPAALPCACPLERSRICVLDRAQVVVGEGRGHNNDVLVCKFNPHAEGAAIVQAGAPWFSPLWLCAAHTSPLWLCCHLRLWTAGQLDSWLPGHLPG